MIFPEGLRDRISSRTPSRSNETWGRRSALVMTVTAARPVRHGFRQE
jgi:hypothetical protein